MHSGCTVCAMLAQLFSLNQTTIVLLMNYTNRRRKLALTVSLAFVAFAAFGFSRPPAPSEQAQRGKVWRPTRIPAGVNYAGSQACAECHKDKVAVQERSEEHTSELQSLRHLVCRLLLEKKKKKKKKQQN